jgi:hypothetical protein
MAQGGGQGELVGAVNVDYRGTRHALGRTADSYAIWDLAGGPPIRTFPLTDEGWAQAWLTYQDLEAAAGWSASESPSAAGYPTAAAPSVMDYPGSRYGLGRAGDQYVIWDLEQRAAVRTFPLNDEGWAQAWPAFQELDGPFTFVPTSYWQKGRPIPIRAMRAGQIVSATFKLYFMHFWTLVGLVAVVVLPVYAVTGSLTVATLRPVTITNTFGTVETFQNPPWVAVVNGVLQFFVVPFLTAAVLAAVADAFLGRRVTLRSAFRVGFRRALPVLWVSLLATLAILVFFIPAFVVLVVAALQDPDSTTLLVLYGVLLLAGMVPAIFVAIRLLFGSSVVVMEGPRGVAALRRSWNLVRGLGGKILGNLLLVGLIVGGVALVVFLILGVILGIVFLGDALSRGVTDGPGLDALRSFFIWFSIVNAAFGVLLIPVVNLAVVLLYFDSRVRKERFNEQVLAAEYGAAFPQRVASPSTPPPEGSPTEGTSPGT